MKENNTVKQVDPRQTMNASDLVDKKTISAVTLGGVLSPIVNRKATYTRDRHIYLHSSPLVDGSAFSEISFSENNGDVCVLPSVESYLESAKFLGWQATELFNTDESPLKIGAVPPGVTVPYTVANIHLSPYFSYTLHDKGTTSKSVMSVQTGVEFRTATAYEQYGGEEHWIELRNVVQNVTESSSIQLRDVLSLLVDAGELYKLFERGFTAKVGFTLATDLGTSGTLDSRIQGTAEAWVYADDVELARHAVTRIVTMHTFIVGHDNTLIYDKPQGSSVEWAWFREKETFQIELSKDYNPQQITLSTVLRDATSHKTGSLRTEWVAPARASLFIDSVNLVAPA